MKTHAAAMTIAAFASLTSTAKAEPVRIVVSAGHRYGTPEERPLRFARDDAARVVEVFTQMGGVRKEHAILVDEPTAGELAAAVERARQIAATHRPEEVTFVLYFSGHGDRARIHLGSEAVSLNDLSARIARVPAALRVIVLDACRTDDSLRSKGMTEEPAFAVAVDANAGSATGTVWIHASAEGDPAQESQELAGGIFTHYWLSGLRGAADADGDRRVTLAESYEYAYHQTLFKSARASGVLQRPTARLDIREAGPIVLTSPHAASSRLLLPQMPDQQFLVYEPRSKRVLAEAWSAPDRRIALALPPGSYLVQRRSGGRGGAAEVALARGEERSLSASEFRDVSVETLARKGGAIVLSPNEVELGYAPATQSDFGFIQRATARYQRRMDGWAFGAGIDASLGSANTSSRHIGETTAAANLALELRQDVGTVTLRAGAGPRVEWIEQRLERTDSARALAASYPIRETNHAIGVGAAAALRASWAITKPVFLTLGAYGTTTLAPSTTGTQLRWSLGAEAGPGLAF